MDKLNNVELNELMDDYVKSVININKYIINNNLYYDDVWSIINTQEANEAWYVGDEYDE